MKQEFKNMIKEQYVSFEVAKLLKEKGFDEGCSFVVNATSKGMMPVTWPTTNSDIKDEKANLIAVPTQQMAMRWLREKYNIIISIAPQRDKYCFTPWQLWDSEWVHTKAMLPLYNSYEEACEAAIKYCLENLI